MTADAGASGSSHRIPSLDGIRAISFMIVFGSHVFGGTLIPGDLGVTVFFFLSGFLITTLLRVEFEKRGEISLRRFWLRRALRILPPVYVVVGVATALAAYIDPSGAVYAPNVAGELFFYANYQQIHNLRHPAEPGLGVVWSLAVEEQFYLLFPLLYVAARKWGMARSRQVWILGALCAAVLAWRCVLVMSLHADSERVFYATDTRIDSILFGCILALWRNPALDDAPRAPLPIDCLYLSVALAVILLCAYSRGTVFTDTLCFSLEGLGLMVIFTGAVRFHRAPPFRTLGFRPLVYLGTLSYSLYLVHDVILRAIYARHPHSHSWQRALAGFGASLLAAWILFELVEKPCGKLRPCSMSTLPIRSSIRGKTSSSISRQ
jgi:peptidoglycan/LPS O-acetylase OafA/YrhL